MPRSFAEGLRAALRQDPDVLLVGEMRDLETISTALTAAETGHLVFGTLHTQTASSTIDRVIDVFPPAQQQQVRIMIANSLQGIVTQILLPTADGSGRVAALEILLPDDAVRNLVRQAKVEQLYTVMQTSSSRGMQTMEQALADLVLRQVVDYEEALARTTRVEQLIGILERAGVVVGAGGVPIVAPSVDGGNLSSNGNTALAGGRRHERHELGLEEGVPPAAQAERGELRRRAEGQARAAEAAVAFERLGREALRPSFSLSKPSVLKLYAPKLSTPKLSGLKRSAATSPSPRFRGRRARSRRASTERSIASSG